MQDALSVSKLMTIDRPCRFLLEALALLRLRERGDTGNSWSMLRAGCTHASEGAPCKGPTGREREIGVEINGNINRKTQRLGGLTQMFVIILQP